jgi:putative ABC transport system permease protein
MDGIIVGVIPDFKTSQLDANPSPAVYVPYQLPPSGPSMTVAIRTRGNPKTVSSMILAAASGADPTQPIYEFRTLETALSDSISPRRFSLVLLGTFATVAVVLALVGIYGVLAYFVTRNTHEIGVRRALGAQRGDILSMVLWQGLKVALFGVVGGLAAAWGLARLMASLLFGVSPSDPQLFAAAAALLITATLTACLIPARRAMRVDPMVALRYEQ